MSSRLDADELDDNIVYILQQYYYTAKFCNIVSSSNEYYWLISADKIQCDLCDNIVHILQRYKQSSSQDLQ